MPGPSGYPDWQRVQNWDGPVGWQLPLTAGAAAQVSPLMDVSRYGYLGGQIVITAGRIEVNFNWYADSGATVVVGTRQWGLDSGGPVVQRIRIPNLGPYCQMSFTLTAGGAYTAGATILPTNRAHPLEFIPYSPQLIVERTVALGAGASANVNPLDYYAGPVRVWTQSALASWEVSVETLAPGGTYSTSDLWTAGGVNETVDTLVQPGSWNIGLVNPTGGAGSITIAVTGSATGST